MITDRTDQRSTFAGYVVKKYLYSIHYIHYTLGKEKSRVGGIKICEGSVDYVVELALTWRGENWRRSYAFAPPPRQCCQMEGFS